MEQLTYYVAKNGVRMHIYKDCLTLKKSKVLTEVNYEALKNNKLDICKKCMKRYDKFGYSSNEKNIENDVNEGNIKEKENKIQEVSKFDFNQSDLLNFEQEDIDMLTNKCFKVKNNKSITNIICDNISNVNEYSSSIVSTQSISMESKSDFFDNTSKDITSKCSPISEEEEEDYKSSNEKIFSLENNITNHTQIILDKSKILLQDDNNYNNEFNITDTYEGFNGNGYYYSIKLIPKTNIKVVLGYYLLYGETIDEMNIDRLANIIQIDKETENIFVCLDMDESLFFINAKVKNSKDIKLSKAIRKEIYYSKNLRIAPYINIQKVDKCKIDINDTLI